MVENIVRKGEIACFKQFLLYSMFSTAFVCQNAVLRGNGLKSHVVLLFTKQHFILV